jgi:hypothetical protein
MTDNIQLPSRTSKIEPLKPFNEFTSGPYAVPNSADHVRERIERNVGKFQSNYLLVIAIGLALYAYLQPSLLVVLAIVGGLVYATNFVDHASSPIKNLTISAHTFTTKEKKQLLIGVAIVIVLISGSLGSLLYGALAPLVLCVAHAALKETSLAAKVAAKVDSALDNAEDKLDKVADAARKRVNAVLPQKN